MRWALEGILRQAWHHLARERQAEISPWSEEAPRWARSIDYARRGGVFGIEHMKRTMEPLPRRWRLANLPL